MLRLWMTTSAVFFASVFVAAVPAAGRAAEVTVPISLVSGDGIGPPIGSIRAVDTANGVRFEPTLADLPPGPHGFHLHENGDCSPQVEDHKHVGGLAAGGHWDPEATGKHLGPEGQGHRGDLPVLVVGPDGRATRPTLPATRLRVADLRGRALVIHAGADNYADVPEPLGGGGERIACGVVP
jgi:Cu-Zn family superoxide dismutase